jgi:mono/diheme cytochrome c family protein
MKNALTLIMTLTLAACGGGASKPATTPAEPAHEEHHASVGTAGSGATVTPPTEPSEQTEPPAKDPKAELLAAEATAWDTAKPVFEKACASCHTSAGKKSSKKKLDHFNFDTYPPGGHHTATIGTTIREVLGLSGEKPTMPYDKPGSVQGDDLAKMKAWTDAWAAADKAGAHSASGAHDHGDDDHDH